MTETTSTSAAATDLEQLEMLRASAADVVARDADLKALRQRRGSVPGYPESQRQRCAELGWLGLLVPEAHGGLGLGLAEMAVVLQELGKGLLADPLGPVALATRVLCHAGDWAGAGDCLAQLADGRALPALAWQEGLGGIDPSAITTRVASDGKGLRLTGGKRFVAGAAGGAGFIVSARSDDGAGLFWVDADAPGLNLRFEWRADQTPVGVLAFDRVAVSPAQVIAPCGEQGLAALERAFDDAVVLASAEMLGVIEAALQMALAYLRTRVQFGKPIGSFQALQHKAADLYVQQELVRAVLQDALLEVGGGGDRRAAAQTASRCKARASEAGLRVTREVIQLHGAIGYTDEHDAGLYLKRALVLSAWLGNASAHRARFAALRDTAAAL